MDNVSSLFIRFKMIRKPKRQTDNICDFAAEFEIIINNESYLYVEDFLILDFAIKIYKWRQYGTENFIYVPLDDDSNILSLLKNEEIYLIKSEWVDNKKDFYVATDLLFEAIDIFIKNLSNYMNSVGLNFYKALKKY